MITLVTVNYNNARATKRLLESLESQTDSDFDIIVVDNDSKPEDRALLGEYAASSSLKLDIIHSDRNRGFSGGNNLAIRKALAQDSEWILLINNDTIATADFIAGLKSRLPAEPAIVAVPLKEGARTAYAGIIQWLKPTLAHIYTPYTTRHTQNLYIIGAGELIHRNVFDKVGLWDEEYFLYFEDADFSARARVAGVPFHWLDNPTISHKVSTSTKSLGSPLLLHYHFRNALRFNWQHAPWWVKIALPFWSVWVIIKQLVKILMIPSRRAQSRAILAGIIDFYAGRSGQIPAPKH